MSVKLKLFPGGTETADHSPVEFPESRIVVLSQSLMDVVLLATAVRNGTTVICKPLLIALHPTPFNVEVITT